MAKRPIFGITNIPEDIKLELSNGTLTVKSGTIFYTANGSKYSLASDVVVGVGGANAPYFIFPQTGGVVSYAQVSVCYSGSSAPTGIGQSAFWLDTTNQVIKYTSDSGSTWSTTTYGLPIAICTPSSGSWVSIDQVFNGFGYIGSTLFVLPGVEGFCPNGKDGFKNLFQIVKHNSLSVLNNTAPANNAICNFATISNGRWSFGFEIVDELPDVQDMVSYKRYYNKKDNFVYTYNGSVVSKESSVPYGYFTTSSSSPYRITSLDVKDEFLVVDLYEYEYASSKPISQYANSEKYTGLFNNLCYMFSNTQTISDWYNVVFNLNTAEGYGLDIWGKILNQGRQFSYNNNGTMEYVYLGGEQTIDGITYSAEQMEETYRLVLFLKALSNISGCTIASLNELLGFYFQDRGRVYVLEYGVMEIRYVFQFYVTKFEKAIFTSSVMPKPTGVLISFEFLPIGDYFGFFVNGIASPTDQPFAPFDNKPFYR